MSDMFIPGLELSKSLFHEIVQPLISSHYPKIKYAAALIGPGSEVLGFDDIISSDHHWGPRLQIFLDEDDFSKYSPLLSDLFSTSLPYEFKGYSTHWSEPDSDNPEDDKSQFPTAKTEGKINHRIEIYTVKSFLNEFLDISSTDLQLIDWMVLPEQRLLEFTSGEVFHDDIGELSETRKTLRYFPDSIWLSKIHSGWLHIAEEMAFVGRTAMVNDELGSKIEASRLVRYIMQLAFILHRQYMPYPKWFSYGFKQLTIGKMLEPILLEILNAKTYKEREINLNKAYVILLDFQNSLKITPKIDAKPKQFFSRDQMVFEVWKILGEIDKIIPSPLKDLEHQLGSVDQLIDYPNKLCDAKFAKKAKLFFR